MAQRLRGRCGYSQADPFRVTFHPERLEEPLRRKKPTTYFVCSMGDLFHRDVKQLWLNEVFEVISACLQHRFLALTKRPSHIRLSGNNSLPNLWLGASVENQTQADIRVADLSNVNHWHHFLSIEPLLGYINLRFKPWDQQPGCAVDWIIVGCESGPKRRKCKPEWIADIVEQCGRANIPCFVKQVSINGRVSHDPAEWPAELRVRQTPW